MLSRTTVCTSLEPVGSQTLLALALVCALVLGAGTAFAAPPAAESIVVVSMQGDVRVTARNQVRAVKPGAIVAPPATIRTGRDGVIELRQGSTTVSVAADTQIDIAASSGADGLLERVVQPKGNVFYDVGKRKAKKLRIETPYLVAVIKGTQFNVAAQDESATVSLFEGHLEIWTPDDSDVVQLNAGEIATRGRNDRTIRVLRMDTGETIRARSDILDSGTRSAASLSVDPTHIDADRALLVSPIDGTTAGGELGITGSSETELRLDVKESSVGVQQALDPNISNGDETVAAGIDASLDVSGSAVTSSADTAIEFGAASIDASADVGADLGSATVGAGLDAAVDLAGVTAADAGVDAGADLLAGTVDLGTTATVGDTAVAGDAAVDLGAGTVDASVAADSLDIGLDVDLGTGTIAADLGTATVEPASVETVVEEVVAPIKGLFGQ